jgi:hypothetical protein
MTLEEDSVAEWQQAKTYRLAVDPFIGERQTGRRVSVPSGLTLWFHSHRGFSPVLGEDGRNGNRLNGFRSGVCIRTPG